MNGAPQTFVERLSTVPVRYPKRVLLALLLFSALVGTGVFRLRFDPSTESVFPEGHWAVETYNRFRDTFGGDEAIFVAVESKQGDVFAPETLSLLREITQATGVIDGVDESFSLVDVPVLRLHPLLGPTLVQVLPNDPAAASPEDLAKWRGEVLATPFVEENLVSTDNKATLVFVVLERLPGGVEGAEKNLAIVKSVGEALKKHEDAGWKIHMAGSPMIKARIMGSIRDDLIVFSGPLLLIALIAATLVLRSWRAPLLVSGVLLVTTVLTLGTMGHLGIAIDSMNTMVPVLILVIGVADCLHLLVEQRAQAALDPEADGAQTITAALGHVCKPCFLTSFTTAIGFGSLLTSDIKPIAFFGLAAALSSLLAFAVTMVFIPACAALFPPPKATASRVVRADRLGAMVVGWPRGSLAVGLALTVLISLGWTRLYADTNFIEFFRGEDRMVKDVLAIQGRFTGVAPCELLVEGPPGASRDPAVLRAMLAFEREFEELEIVDRAVSAADFVAAAVGVMRGERGIPNTREGLNDMHTLLGSLGGGRLPTEQLISPDCDAHPGAEWLRISVRAQAVGSSRFAGLVTRVGELEAKHFTPIGVKVTPTGTSVVFSQTADRIMEGQIESFLWAFLSITVVMVIALRSIPLGLISAIPNFVPIAALIGTMGYLDIPLNSFNSMVASIAIGIAVDDTIHILTGFKRFRAQLPLREAVQETVAHEGAAILATSAVLFSGFCVLLLASFVPTANFGILTATAIAAALLGDLVVLPGLLLLIPWRAGLPAKEAPPHEDS